MMTVLYVETGSGYGGSAHSLLQLLRAIDRTRVQPIVAVYHEGGAIQRLRALGVPVHRVPGPISHGESYGRLLVSWLRHELPRTIWFVRLMRRERVALIHLNTSPYANVAALTAAKLSRRPVVCHMRIFRTPRWSERLFGRWVDQFIILTKHAEAHYRRFWPKQPMRVIYNAAESDAATSADTNGFRRELGVSAATPLVGLVARCVPGKGYEEFLQAAALVHPQHPKAQFLIIGNGPGGNRSYEAKMQELAQTLGLNGAVRWLGWRDDSSRVFRSLDLVVQASSTFPEGLSRVIVEAMAHGTPVLATALPSSSEALARGEAGWLVPPGDAKALAQGVLILLEQPATRRALGERGQQRASRLFDPAAHAQAVEALYHEMLEVPR
jgi:glycosyltransferase involved in cell wall biosynthesis